MSQINVNNIRAKDGVGAVGFPGGINVTGVATATTFSGNLTGNVTGNVTGNTSGSAGSLAAGATGSDLTLSGNLTVNGTQTVIDTATLSVEDANIGIGSVTTPTNTTANGGGLTLFGGSDGDKTLTWNNGTPKYWALGGGYLQVPGLDVSSLMKEGVNIVSGEIGFNSDINIENGMVHYFTTTETQSSSANIRYNASTTLNSVMNIGEAVSITLITTAATAGYVGVFNIDGNFSGSNGYTINTHWTGGSMPSDGGTSGVDLYAATIIKTADKTFTVIATQTKTS